MVEQLGIDLVRKPYIMIDREADTESAPKPKTKEATMPTQVSLQLTDAQIRQIEALTAAGFGNRSDVVRIAVDRMYQQEARSMTTEIVARNGETISITDLAAAIRAITGPEPANSTTIDDWLAEGDADYIATATIEGLAAEWQALDTPVIE